MFDCFWLSVPVQLIAWKDSSPNDLLCVEWDVKPYTLTRDCWWQQKLTTELCWWSADLYGQSNKLTSVLDHKCLQPLQYCNRYQSQLQTTPSPDWNCQWGPPGARIAYTRAMSEHRCFPKKRLSTHTMHFKWHHRNLSIRGPHPGDGVGCKLLVQRPVVQNFHNGRFQVVRLISFFDVT